MKQESLFDVSNLPDGFFYQPDFLTEADEAKLLSHITVLNLETFDFHGYKAKRRIVEFGWDYDFGSRRATKGNPFPEFLVSVQNRAADLIGIPAENIVEAVVTEYPPGAPIGWHRDVPQFERIIGISILGSCRMRLRPYKGEGKTVSIDLDPRSIYVMSGAARWNFQHSIPPVKSLRYSITFRTLREMARRKAG